VQSPVATVTGNAHRKGESGPTRPCRPDRRFTPNVKNFGPLYNDRVWAAEHKEMIERETAAREAEARERPLVARGTHAIVALLVTGTGGFSKVFSSTRSAECRRAAGGNWHEQTHFGGRGPTG
jgi:hypothetical protein